MIRVIVLSESSLPERRALASTIEGELSDYQQRSAQCLWVARPMDATDAGAKMKSSPEAPRGNRGLRRERAAGGDQPFIHFAVTDDRLELRLTDAPRAAPVFVDFAEQWTVRRMSRRRWRGDPLLKAVDPHGNRPSVLDATAGFGRDAFTLAAYGCRIAAYERSPILGRLLLDGFARATVHHPPDMRDALSRLTIRLGDARTALRSFGNRTPSPCVRDERDVEDTRTQPRGPQTAHSLPSRPDVVYLDPMYPERRRSVVVRKELLLCRLLVGGDDDAGDLLDAARRAARVRVVVKRHRHARPIASDVHHVIASKLARFDVYDPLES